MLVQFKLKNVLSFKEETILDMTAINAYKEHKSNLIDIGTKEKYLKVASIYGANASGKSNLVFAMHYFQNIIIKSFNNINSEEETALQQYYCPYSFEEGQDNSEYEITVIRGDNEYRYGFEYNDESIVIEWLYKKSLKTSRKTTIFERTTNNVTFGASIRKECDAFKEQIPPETLVLSFMNRLKLKTTVFKNVYDEILNTGVAFSDFWDDMVAQRKLLPRAIDENKEQLIDFLAAIDTGISDISYDIENDKIHIYTVHIGKDGNEYALNLYDESEGTLKGIMLFVYSLIAIRNDKSLFVDELNVKLHPLLLKFIIDLFYMSGSKAQLIYTTHDTTLLDKKFFRRDQIWFVQKDTYGYSELVALAEYKVRSDASFEKDYLAGVYGGIPLLKDFQLK